MVPQPRIPQVGKVTNFSATETIKLKSMVEVRNRLLNMFCLNKSGRVVCTDLMSRTNLVVVSWPSVLYANELPTLFQPSTLWQVVIKYIVPQLLLFVTDKVSQ